MTFLLSVLLMGAVSCSGSDYNSETTDNENSTTDERIDLNGKKILIASWLSRISSGKGTDLATGIRNTKANKGKSNDLSYSISGARVPTTTHGVLISGGKKYINRF